MRSWKVYVSCLPEGFGDHLYEVVLTIGWLIYNLRRAILERCKWN